jgi:hypothetical protein
MHHFFMFTPITYSDNVNYQRYVLLNKFYRKYNSTNQSLYQLGMQNWMLFLATTCNGSVTKVSGTVQFPLFKKIYTSTRKTEYIIAVIYGEHNAIGFISSKTYCVNYEHVTFYSIKVKLFPKYEERNKIGRLL